MATKFSAVVLGCLLLAACETRPGLKPAANDDRFVGIAADAARRGHKDTFTVADLDKPLQQLKLVSPRYPGHLLEKGRTGTALVSFTITETGDVTDVVVIQASHADFGASAASAVSQWKFSVPMHQGQPVRIRVAQEVPFTITIQP